MCGILAVISKQQDAAEHAAQNRRALSQIIWRGPDSMSSSTQENLFLGQTILSLTGELTHEAGMHLQSGSNRFQLLFNGEIYNFRELAATYLEKSKKFKVTNETTDSEVLINLYEVLEASEIPKLLDGMFAYVVFDKREKVLHVCRDVQGEKSLYLFEDSLSIVISSEITPILLLKPHIEKDYESLQSYFLSRHCMQREHTMYKGITQFSIGSETTFNLKTFAKKTRLYLQLSDFITPEKMSSWTTRSMDSLVDELDDILKRSVKTMVPNRLFASVVSGGVDSSLLSRYITNLRRPNCLVAVNHRGKDCISSDLIGFEKVLDQKIDLLDVDLLQYANEIHRCQRVLQAPLFSHSFVGQAIQSRHVRNLGCKVLFGGEAADELFGGYACYLDAGRRTSKSVTSPSLYSGGFDHGLKWKSPPSERFQAELVSSWEKAQAAYSFIKNIEERNAQAMMFCDLEYQLPNVGLRGGDMMSMMWSIETRSIFLRKDVIAFALNLPLFAKSDASAGIAPLMRSKPILKKLFLRYFPGELLYEKQGFSGFPNESKIYLGPLEDFIAIDAIGIDRSQVDLRHLKRETEWKLINAEYFLRI